MNKLLITRWKGQILTALTENGVCRSLDLEPDGGRGGEKGSAGQEGKNSAADPGACPSLLGNIYIGKVKNVVKNINAAFVDLGGGQMGYYSLTENERHLFACPAAHAPGIPAASSPAAAVFGAQAAAGKKTSLRPGDEIIVQVQRDGVKTKDPVLSSNLNFPGKYLVLTVGKTLIGFSMKVRDQEWKEELRPLLEAKRQELCQAGAGNFGLIVRTNAREAGNQAILDELAFLCGKKEKLLSQACCRTCYSLLTASEPFYLSTIRDLPSHCLSEIVTDDKACFEALQAYLAENQKEDEGKLTFYQDPLLPLIKLYSLETAMEQALGKRVWLKSGGYLVIEPTEALTVIDVNTGKYVGKKTPQETIFKINREAAVETARQLRLRNLSGIILIDFIDMAAEEDKRQLLKLMEQELLSDPVKTVLVEMTKLGLVEITRKKVRRPLAEQVKGRKGSVGADRS